jgi:hypothetical protein
MEKLKIKSLLEMAELIFKNARGTTVSEQRAINNFIKTKSKIILRGKIEDLAKKY